MADTSIASKLTGVGKTLSDVFISLSAEYPALLSAIILIFAFGGALICASACIDFMKMGKRDQQSAGMGGVFTKLLGGSAMIDLAFWAKVWTDTLWSLSDPMDIASYSAGAGESNAKVALYAAVGFLVLVGYVTIGKAYYQITKLGALAPEARADVKMMIVSRVVAGSAMIAAMHLSKVIDESTGFNWLPG
jgi:hypothetical protein